MVQLDQLDLENSSTLDPKSSSSLRMAEQSMDSQKELKGRVSQPVLLSLTKLVTLNAR